MLLNHKGFNLFTALISFLLIMLTVLLIQSMIQTERNAADTISSIETRSELEATAEMARADAMQVFNYALRERIEDWLTDEERGVVMLELQNKSWEQIQREFAESKFGTTGEGSKFADFAASSLEGIFYSPSHFGNYTISIEGSESLKPGLRTAISKSIDDFFTVVGCPAPGDPKNCPLGTFYVNLHLERLTQEEYENLPKLRVIDKKTGEELKEIILPRTTFRIYVPLRFFKAIAEARALTHFPLEAEVDSPQDRGLFSPRVHNEMEAMGLGMCDFGYCAPRTDPFAKPSSDETNNFCPGDREASEWRNGLFTELKIVSNEPWLASFDGRTYNANNNENNPWLNMRETLAEIASAKVCDVLRQARTEGYMDTSPNDLFTIVGNECEVGETKLAYDISINADARDSKVIGQDEMAMALTDPGRNIGLYRNPETGEVDYPSIVRESLECTDSEPTVKARCVEVKSIKVTIAFREEDENYMVRTPREGEEHLYRIAVYDNTYVPFTANWQQGEKGSISYLYGMSPETTNCSMAAGQGWYCKTVWGGGELGDQVSIGCKPA